MFWIRGDSRDHFTGSYEGVAKEANLPETLTGNDKLLAVRKWIESQHSWLVVVDNADDLDDSRSQYLDYVPRPQSCSNGAIGAVVWTSRDGRIIYLPYGINEPIDASVMQRSESLLLYRKLLHRAKPSTSVECVKPASEDEQALLDQLGDLPLAISQAAAFIRRNGNIKRYVNRLRNSEAEAWDLLSREQLDPYRHARQNSVMKTWIVSLTRLKEEEARLEEEAAEEEEAGINTLQILYAVAFLDNQGITLELLQYSVGTDVHEDDLQEAVARLVDYSFLQYQGDIEEGSQTYSQHRLVSMAMRHYLNSKGSRSIHAERAFNIVLRCFPTEDHETADQCRVYLPHALRILTETGCSHFQQLADQLLPYLAFSYTCHGRYHEAQKTLEQLIALQDQLLDCSAARKLEAQSALGWTLILQGEFEDAMSILTSTLDSQKLILETNHPSIWMTTTNLARAVQKIGQYDKAEKLQLAVLEYHKQQSGPAALDTLGAMNNLALTYRYQERFVEAETIFKDILAEWKQSDLTRPLLALGAQNNLGLVFRAQNKLDEAEELLDKTIEEYTTRLGDSHPDTITSMDSLFHVYITQGRFNKARNIGLKVKNLSRTVLGDKHPLFLSASKELDKLQEMSAFTLSNNIGNRDRRLQYNIAWTPFNGHFATNNTSG
jgi:tetratricopeptide (TPR) repeat protein